MYDLALSFAGEQREVAEAIAVEVRNNGYSVFYDQFERIELWGTDLTQSLPERYKNSRFTMVIISDEYISKFWTTLERQCVIEKFLELGANSYLLPVIIKGCTRKLPGLSKLTGYIEIDGMNDIEHLKLLALGKLSTL